MNVTKQQRILIKQEFEEKLKHLNLTTRFKTGALLLHGLTGLPNEMRSVAQILESIGCDVEVPLLAGHGATHRELLKTGWKDWLGSARYALKRLGERCDVLFVGGLSMGGLMPVLLASENPKIRGIVSMSPTIKYDAANSSNPLQILIPMVDFFPILGEWTYWTEREPYGLKDKRLVQMINRELKAAKLGGDSTSRSGFTQFRTYSGSIRQLQHMVTQVKKIAPQVECPVLIMHSLEDTVTSKANADMLYQWLTKCQDKKIIYLEGCDHLLTADLRKEEVAFNFADFICRISGSCR